MGLVLFGVVYRPRVAKVAGVAWYMGGGVSSWLAQIFMLAFILSRVAKVAEVAWFSEWVVKYYYKQCLASLYQPL